MRRVFRKELNVRFTKRLELLIRDPGEVVKNASHQIRWEVVGCWPTLRRSKRIGRAAFDKLLPWLIWFAVRHPWVNAGRSVPLRDETSPISKSIAHPPQLTAENSEAVRFQELHSQRNLCARPSEFAIARSKRILLKFGWKHAAPHTPP